MKSSTQVDRVSGRTGGDLGDPIGRGEGAVEDHVGLARSEAFAQHVGQLRCPRPEFEGRYGQARLPR